MLISSSIVGPVLITLYNCSHHLKVLTSRQQIETICMLVHASRIHHWSTSLGSAHSIPTLISCGFLAGTCHTLHFIRTVSAHFASETTRGCNRPGAKAGSARRALPSSRKRCDFIPQRMSFVKKLKNYGRYGHDVHVRDRFLYMFFG